MFEDGILFKVMITTWNKVIQTSEKIQLRMRILHANKTQNIKFPSTGRCAGTHKAVRGWTWSSYLSTHYKLLGEQRKRPLTSGAGHTQNGHQSRLRLKKVSRSCGQISFPKQSAWRVASLVVQAEWRTADTFTGKCLCNGIHTWMHLCVLWSDTRRSRFFVSVK